MKHLLPCLFALAFGAAVVAHAAEEPAPKSSVSDLIKAKIEADAKSGKAKQVGPAKTQAAADAAHPEPPPPAPPPANTPANTLSAAETAKAKEQAPTVLDPVEVQKRKLSEFERDVHKQEADIIREKKNTTSTEADKALNNSTVAKALSVFGGESSEYRANVAKERVSLMEEEKDIIEAINHSKTKEEKQLLQKQLEEMRKMRRDLEKSHK